MSILTLHCFLPIVYKDFSTLQYCYLPHRDNKEKGKKAMWSAKVCAITLRPRRQCFLSSWVPIPQYLSSLISY